MVFLWILVSILMFSIIVLLHEYGHYKTAKIFWIHVDEFGLWIPPRAKKLWANKQGTLFSLNWIPLGWFVKIAGESEIFLEYYDKKWTLLALISLSKNLKEHEDIFDKHGQKIKKQERKYIAARIRGQKVGQNFYEKHIIAKSLVLLAGVIMNFLLAGVIFSLFFFIGVKPLGINSFIPTQLPSKIIPTLEQSIGDGFITQSAGVLLYPVEDSLAETSGIMQGDIMLSIDEIIFSSISEIQAYIKSQANSLISLSLQRGDELLSIDISPDSQWMIGTYIWENLSINEDFEYKYWAIESLKYGFLECYYQARLTLSGLGILVSNIISPETPQDRSDALDQVAGPIGIVSVITQSLQWGFTLLLMLWAIISVNLWVFNLLPIPALDGWRLLLLWIRTGLDKIFWKTALSGNIENTIHVIFFLLLIALSILIAYNDIIKLL